MAMRFEAHDLPDDGDLLPLFRQIVKQPFVEPRGDVGDFSPFDWIGRLYKEWPDWRNRVDDALAAALTAEEPLPQRALEQIAKLPVRSFLPRLFDAIAGRCAELAARRDSERTDGRSILGSIVHVAAVLSKTARPTIELARELAAIDRPQDGWPFSFLLALPGDVEGQLPRVLAVLKQLEGDEFKLFINGMMADGPPWTDVVFEEIARGPTELRDRVVGIVRAATDELERGRSVLAMMEFPDDPEAQALVRAAAQRPNPWPEYAARLGVDPSRKS